MSSLFFSVTPNVSARAVEAAVTLKRRLGDTLQKGKDNVITPSAQAISKGANYAKDRITGKFVNTFLVLCSLETQDKSRRKLVQKRTSKTKQT